MGKPTGFMELQRQTPKRRDVLERLSDYLEVYNPLPEEALRAQGARCNQGNAEWQRRREPRVCL